MKRGKLALLGRARNVLPTESAEQFESEHLAFERAINPRDRIEQMHVEDLAHHNWKVSQRRRISFAVFRETLIEVLYDLLVNQLGALKSADASILIDQWAQADVNAKAEVLEILNKHGLDEPAIEAEAFSRCSGKLATIEQSEASHASRRDKTLPNLAFYREMLARQTRQPVDTSPEEGEFTRIEHVRDRGETRGH
jgi:hypothetical protein